MKYHPLFNQIEEPKQVQTHLIGQESCLRPLLDKPKLGSWYWPGLLADFKEIWALFSKSDWETILNKLRPANNLRFL